MKTYFTFLITILLSSNILFSQSSYTNVMISNQNQPEEPSICINPKNLNQVVAGANIHSSYYSSDGGNTWVIGSITNSSWGVWGDPIITVDTAGSFYYFHLADDPGHNFPYYVDRIICQKSTNGGVSWNDPGSFTGFNLPKIQDKHGVAVDWTHGPRGNWIYVTWTEFDDYGTNNPVDSSRIMFSRSTDGGNTLTAAHRISRRGGDCIDGDYTTEGAVPCVGPNGELYDAWSGPLGINNFAIFFDRSTDGGNTWLPDNIIAGSQPGGWDYVVSGISRNNGLPCTLCDVSNSPYRGTIYVNYTDSAGPGDHDVKIIKSSNGGNNWSAPIRVNDDPAGKEQFFSWMAIDQVTGILYIVFYDRRNYTNTATDVYLAHSSDGGTTWINERISASSFVPNSNAFFGDYNGITAYNGKIRPIWTRLTGTNSLSVWTAIIDIPVGVSPKTAEIPKSFVLYQNYPNPFNPTTKIRFDIPTKAAGETTLKVYDQLGREAAILLHENLNAGSYEISWDASDLSSGVYFYKLEAKSFIETKKMVLVK
jgi:hypothetical protein